MGETIAARFPHAAGKLRTIYTGVDVDRFAPVWSPRGQDMRFLMRERLGLALDLLRDPRFDALITGRSAFAELPSVLAGLASGDIPALCHLVTYGE